MRKLLGRLSMIPVEILALILEFSNDLDLAVKLEAINASLPMLYPDAGSAIDAIDLISTFPGSLTLVK
ncbi:hypothetical protein HDU97_006197, partial [Phlyctochytrium planicorne]